jgi:hypothetical protein
MTLIPVKVGGVFGQFCRCLERVLWPLELSRRFANFIYPTIANEVAPVAKNQSGFHPEAIVLVIRRPLTHSSVVARQAQQSRCIYGAENWCLWRDHKVCGLPSELS